MAYTNPMTYLKEVIDPMIAAASDENPLANDEFLSLIDIDVLDAVPEGNIVELYGAFSDPAVYIGDRWMYDPSERGINFGKMKLKKMTLAIRISEDEMGRMMKRGDASIIRKMIKRQMKDQVMYLRENLIKFCVTKFSTSDPEADALINGFFGLSSDGDISNPTDLNSTPGAIENLDSVIWTGASRTERNVATFVAAIVKLFTKLDFLTHIKLPKGQIYLLVHPVFKAILDTNYDIVNTSSNDYSELTYTAHLAASGVTVLETAYVDVTAGFSTGNSNDCVAFTNPKDFTLWLIKPLEGDGWMDWDLIDDGKSRFYIKRKKLEFGLEIQAYGLHTSATAHSYFKTVVPLKTVPYTA